MECRVMSSVPEAAVPRSTRRPLTTRSRSRSLGDGDSMREGMLQLETPLPLHFGARLENVRIAWRLIGNPERAGRRRARRHFRRTQS